MILSKDMTRVKVCAVIMAASSCVHAQVKVQDHSRFCVKRDVGKPGRAVRAEVVSATFADAGDGQWKLQGYPPLIDEKAGAVFEQAIFTGKWLSKVRLRSFREDYQVTVEYRFNESGELVGTRAGIQRGELWYAEANLYSDGRGGVSEPSVTYSYRPGGLAISTPEDGRDYTPMFATVKIYKTTDEIPCAELLKEAEKMNATQK
jgi:hypothetical protein